uniref:CIDE-N domain-containing protein n=1 Tax=Glossina brevipalpis TaxID=37001 RepID=A0A1A9WQI0_9MUSC
MWSNALCTLGVTKPICNCLSIRQVAAAAAAAAATQGATITTGPTPSNNTSAESRGKRPLKIWDSWRNVRKGVVVSTFEELLVRGKDKLGVPASEPVRLVLESDGTQIEDGEYFRTLANNTVLLLLRQGERWYPTGVDVIKAAISAIPKIVCETIHALELHDETPSWKIMDNKGRVTVVLHWDQRQGGGGGGGSGSGAVGGGLGPSGSGANNTNGLISSDKYSPSKKGLSAQSSLDSKSVSSQSSQQRYTSPQITVISDEGPASIYHPGGVVLPGVVLPGTSRRLSKQGGSFDSAVGAVHVHTPECAHHAHTPSRAGSPSTTECDFHCCALHEEGRKIAVHKSVATSPIQDGTSSPQPQQQVTLNMSSVVDPTMGGSMQRRSSGAKGHVRFLDIAPERDSSESETENTVMEDDKVTTEKFLLLIDQLSVDQKRHLSIKDIGIILERLNSKILDVERLDRESESDDCYNWTIKATIRGDALRELGVIYNGNYYAISEHPGYKEEVEENGEEVEEEDEEDRI